MKRFFVALSAVLFCCALGSTQVVAAEGGLKIATMDLKKVLEFSKAGQAAQVTVKQKFEEYQAKLGKKEESLLALKDEIDKKGSVWSEEVRNQKKKEFQRGVQDLDEESKTANADMKDFERKQIEPLLKMLETIIADYGKAQGYSVILDATRGVVYEDESLDISAKLGAELDKRHAAGEVKAEGGEAVPAAKPAAKANKGEAKR